MIQIPNIVKPFLLSGCGAVAAWAVLTLPDNARASAPVRPVSYSGRTFSPQELESGRTRLLAVNDAFAEIGAVQQNPRITAITSENRARILNMDNLGLTALAECEPHLIRMQAAADTMRTLIVNAQSSRQAGGRPVHGVGGHASGIAAAEEDPNDPCPYTDGFPCVEICPFVGPPFTDPDCALTFSLREATIVVEWTSATVCDVLGNVVVAAGFGGNFSILCVAVHVLTLAADLAWEPFDFEQDEIAGAEAHTTLVRTGHLHTELAALSAAVTGPSGLAGKLDALTAKVDALQAAQCETLRLLCLPQAWRHSEISTCEGQPGFPYHQ